MAKSFIQAVLIVLICLTYLFFDINWTMAKRTNKNKHTKKLQHCPDAFPLKAAAESCLVHYKGVQGKVFTSWNTGGRMGGRYWDHKVKGKEEDVSPGLDSYFSLLARRTLSTTCSAQLTNFWRRKFTLPCSHYLNVSDRLNPLQVPGVTHKSILAVHWPVATW